eukprot:scaffold23565_cov71-Phaeocystis_antarctica.AAC.1
MVWVEAECTLQQPEPDVDCALLPRVGPPGEPLHLHAVQPVEEPLGALEPRRRRGLRGGCAQCGVRPLVCEEQRGPHAVEQQQW